MRVVTQNDIVHLIPQLLTGRIAVDRCMANQPTLFVLAVGVQPDFNAVVLHVNTSAKNAGTSRYFTSRIKLSPFRQTIRAKFCPGLFFPGFSQNRVHERL